MITARSDPVNKFTDRDILLHSESSQFAASSQYRLARVRSPPDRIRTLNPLSLEGKVLTVWMLTSFA
jgi:hypothetical protein